MGKATRWLRGLLGMKKYKEKVENNANYAEKRDKKRWSFGKSGKETGELSQIPANIPVTKSGWTRSYIAENQNEHAIAVAAATAAAADAAVAAAQAAVAVVRLTSQGRGGLFNGGRERWAAIKIQSVFRGYLALVRGYIVRKRAAATLQSMQALVRAQATVQFQRARRLTNTNYRFHAENRARNSSERFDETRSEFHSKRLSASYDPSLNAYDESPKIVEIDTYKPKVRSRRIYSCTSEYGDDQYYQELSSPIPCPIPARLSIPNCRRPQDFDHFFIGEDYKLATAQSTPRFSSSRPSNAPVTPAKSVCGDRFFMPYSNCPNYMANTQSFKAKLRSLSAPKQRPDTGLKRRLSLNEVMASRTSFSGVRMQQPCTQVQEDFGF
ncbi:uncharacterized protein LOC111380112 isoform X2 [Olea europaea var. sylvestris]|uniref:uncharacterized protein LOC111380112 isoform X2 n=1 Tax=Olea europaea var. sylvestris TaxID=158386 RepID=UPI000C1D6088|nr:uncharacterized protein LOC111380112 isoform X2 [Olea europaea var. sylvestris]